MKPAALILFLILSGAVRIGAFAQEPFHAMEGEVLKILRAKYPDAELGKDKDLSYIHAFSHKMREFVIYRLNKTGDWQKPFNVQGPDRGGLSVRFYVKKGKWEGA